MKVFFLSGSDTDVGKTYITSKLIQTLQNQGLKALAIKPIETGANPIALDSTLHLQDAQRLFPQLTLDSINLYSFPLPASPFVADPLGEIECEKIFSHIASFEGMLDILVVEGAGGLFVPIKRDSYMIDFALELQERFGSELIFVCDDRLGMLNRILSGKFILENRGVKHHLFINLREREVFEKINAPYLQVIDLKFESDIKSLALKIGR